MFEWDEDKRQRNIEEHSVDFRVAVRIFNNPVIEVVDERENYNEVRYRALGRDEHKFTW
ncbi:MAG: BrnT family toxin [Methylococcales bacterium]